MKQIAKKSYAFFLLTEPIIKAGKDNVTISTPGLFGCKKISFQRPFSDGQQVKVLASFGHTVKVQHIGLVQQSGLSLFLPMDSQSVFWSMEKVQKVMLN